MVARKNSGDAAAPRTTPGRSGGRDLSPRTRATYAGVLRQLAAWLDGRGLDDESLAAYLTHLRDAGGAPSTAALTVCALRRDLREAGRRDITGKLTRRVLEGFRRKTGPDAPRRPGLTADECAAVLKTCIHRRRNGRGLERAETAERRGLVDGAIVALTFHGALRRSEVAALRWADIDLSDGDPVVVTLRRQADRGEDKDFRFLAGGCAAAVRRLHAATTPAPTDPVVGLGVHQINRRFAAACAAAGIEGRRTAHSGRVGLAVDLRARGYPTEGVQAAGGWKGPAMVAHYTTRLGRAPRTPAATRGRRAPPAGRTRRAGSGRRAQRRRCRGRRGAGAMAAMACRHEARGVRAGRRALRVPAAVVRGARRRAVRAPADGGPARRSRPGRAPRRERRPRQLRQSRRGATRATTIAALADGGEARRR